jgi:hypothetical protein
MPWAKDIDSFACQSSQGLALPENSIGVIIFV